jgi:hypothetical protein
MWTAWGGAVRELYLRRAFFRSGLGTGLLASLLVVGVLTPTAQAAGTGYGAADAGRAGASSAHTREAESGTGTNAAKTGSAAVADVAVTQDQARAAAARSGQDVEVASLRDETSETYATAGGAMKTVVHLRPVRTRVDGQWKDLDTTLVKRADGSVGPVVAATSMAFSGGGAAQPLVTFERAGRRLSLSWPTALPAPVLDGDSATYAQVLPGVDLRVQAEADGASEVLVVHDAAAAANPELAALNLGVDTSGLTVATAAGGGLTAVDTGAGGVVFEAPQPLMWDSGTSPASADPTASSAARSGPSDKSGAPRDAASASAVDPADGPPDSAQVAPVGVALDAGRTHLELTPDQHLLKSAHYPVYIDPQWSSPKASAWTMASRYWASSPQWKFNGDPDAGMGYCAGDSRCAPEDVKRLFFQVSTSAFAGKNILSAEFVAHETHSYSCSARNVELWRTGAISPSTTWNSQLASGFWIDRLDTVSAAHGWSSDCAAGDIEFQALRAVQQAAAYDWSTTTFGLKASDEADPYSWKRFSDDAYLRVEYNLPPTQLRMSQLTTDPGGACADAGHPKQVRIRPTLSVDNVSDPDGDQVKVQFGAFWDTGDGKGYIQRWTAWSGPTYKKSHSDFSVALPSSAPQGKKIGWYARVYDGAQYSPWSYDGSAYSCALVYDTSVPAGPSISSLQYPRSNPSDPDDPWTDGVGRYGTFTIDSSSTDVVRYWFGVNGDPSSAHALNVTGGASASMKFMPTKPGVNWVSAQAFDAAGNGSEIRTYQFRVRAGQPDRLTLGLNEPAGSASVAGTGGDWKADLHGGAATAAAGVNGGGLHLDGADDYASTVSPVLNTAKSFTVSVWAKLPAQEPTQPSMALSQNGTYSSGYQLLYSSASHGWGFARFTSDDAGGGGYVRASQPACPAGDTACAAARLGTWTHVAGEFDNVAHLLKLYVNGTMIASAPFSSPWDSRGQTLFGASAQNGVLGSFFSGDLDDAEFFDYKLTDAQIAGLAAKQPVGTDRPAKVVWPFDEDSGAVSVTGRAQQVTARLNNGTRAGQEGVAGSGLSFDGVDDTAVTTQPVLDTYQSFAVSLWAKPSVDSRSQVAVFQSSPVRWGFQIYHNDQGWVFQRATADTADAALVKAQETACPATQPTCPAAHLGEWTHVVAVYDADIQQILLYVNGVKVASTAYTDQWAATGPLTLGAFNPSYGSGSYFKGGLDDVRFYDRALSGDEVTTLFKQNPVVKGRWQLETASGTPPASPDASTGNHPVTLYNGATTGSGWVDNGALNLNGTSQYAATSGVPIDTSRSFTVTAWALPSAGRPDRDEAVISQEGTNTSAFQVRYVAATGHWQIVMPGADSSSAATSTADNGLYDASSSGGWNHLALVYDAFAGEMRLYVNGQLQQTVCTDTDGDGTPDDPACTDTVSWASNTIGFNATKSLQLGRAKTNGVWGQYWSGSLDDVWAFQGVLTPAQVQKLAYGAPGMPTTVPADN